MNLRTFAAATLLCLSPLAHAAQPLDRIIVVVNDGVILQSDLDIAMESAKRQIRARNIALPDDSVLRSQVLDRLILVRLQTQRAQQAGIRVDDRELNDVITGIAQQSGMSLGEFADRLRKEGEDFLVVRDQIRDEVLVSRVRAREVDNRVSISDQDIDLFLAQNTDDSLEYRLAHILVAIPDGATDTERADLRTKAAGILRDLRNGEDFAQTAIAKSDGQQALSGGDLDWRKAADLPALFASTAAKLGRNQVSELLETSSGYHIIKLLGSRGGDAAPQQVTETKARHILLMSNAVRDEDQTRLQIKDLYDRVQRGEKFEDLAKQFSEDPGSKNIGGDLGWQPPGVFAPEFQIRLDQLKINDTASPFRTQFGWHIAQVLERRTRDTTEETRRARARGAIQQRKVAEEYDIWLRRLRAEAYIEYRAATDASASKS